MSFSFEFLPIPDEPGPLTDIFAGLTFDTMTYYFLSWARYMITSWWGQWMIWGGFVWLGIRVLMSLIEAFGRTAPPEPEDRYEQ